MGPLGPYRADVGPMGPYVGPLWGMELAILRYLATQAGDTTWVDGVRTVGALPLHVRACYQARDNAVGLLKALSMSA